MNHLFATVLLSSALSVLAVVPTGLGLSNVGLLARSTPTGGGGGPTDPSFASVTLLLHMDGSDTSTTFTDSSSSTRTVTAYGNAQLAAASPKFGSAAGSYDGNGDMVYMADDASLDLGSGDFTIEWWLKWTSLGTGYQTIYDHGYAGTGGIVIQTGYGDGRWIVYLNGSVILTESDTLGNGTWGFYQVVRSGSTVTLYRDGVSKGSGSSSANLNSGDSASIGARRADASYGLYGQVDDFRITKGVARSNAVPTATHPDY